MKRTVKIKNLIAFTAVLILLVSITVSPAYAISVPSPQRIKAGIAAAITAINIAMTSATAPIQEMIDFIGDPFDYEYTYAEAWNDRPQIQIWDDYIEIDDVPYTDIWISNEAAEKFRVNAFDFKSAYNIASNTNGTFASGEGFLDGIPLYEINNQLWTQNYDMFSTGSYSLGRASYTISSRDATQNNARLEVDGNSTTRIYQKTNFPYVGRGTIVNNVPKYSIGQTYNGQIVDVKYVNAPNSVVTLTPFDFDWVSSNIPLDEELPEDTGMMIRIPSYDPNGNKYLEPFFVDNPEFRDNEPITVDVNIDPEIMTKLDDLFDIIAPIIPIINNNLGDIQFIENHQAPAPVPDVPIIDATVPQVVQPIINEIQNQGDIISQSVPPIIESIPKIDEICNNIDTAPYHDLDTGLDRLPSFFLPFITDLRSALGIWHYVTEWLAQISTTFAFISGCLVGTSIMTPIYAAIAGFMCIKIYRRMTA